MYQIGWWRDCCAAGVAFRNRLPEFLHQGEVLRMEEGGMRGMEGKARGWMVRERGGRAGEGRGRGRGKGEGKKLKR